jgi:hypothetical protein
MSEQIELRDVELILKYCTWRLGKAKEAIDSYLEEPRPPEDRTHIVLIQEKVSPLLQIRSQHVALLLSSWSSALGKALDIINEYLKASKQIPEAVRVMEVEIRPELVKAKEIIDFCIEPHTYKTEDQVQGPSLSLGNLHYRDPRL